MRALPRFHNAVNARYMVGDTYTLIEHLERSSASHAHYFASVNDGWMNLPEEHAERFPSAEHLRKFALIRTGYSDSHTLVCSSKAEALRVAQFMRPIDEFAVVTVQGTTVTRFTAKSQSYRAMGREDFQKSKDAVLDYIAGLIGVTSQALASTEGKAA